MSMKLSQLPPHVRKAVAAQIGHAGASRDEMNGAERAYANRLISDQRTGYVLWWSYGAIKFRLAGNTWYTPDFAVILKDGGFEFVEVKGFLRDDAAVKFKVAAEAYPWALWRMVRKAKGGAWETIYEIGEVSP